MFGYFFCSWLSISFGPAVVHLTVVFNARERQLMFCLSVSAVLTLMSYFITTFTTSAGLFMRFTVMAT